MKLKERLHNIQHVIDCQKSELISHQQLMVLYTVTIIIIGVLSFAVCGLTGAYSSYNTVINICILLFAVITFPLFLLGYIQCRTALYILSAVMSIFVSIEMIFSLFYPCCFENRDTLITSDIGILNLLAFILVSSYMLKAAILLTACAMTTYTACIIVSGSNDLQQNFLLYSIIFILVIILGFKMSKELEKLHKENLTLKTEEQRIIEKLGLNKEQITSLVHLSDKSVKNKERNAAAHDFMESISLEARHRLISTIENYIKEREVSQHNLSEIFPELTPSEIAICRLVLQDKSTSEICIILDKTRGNVSSQRVHIRSKLGLSPSEPLLDCLKKRIATTQVG